jgi:hypothetical protein
MVAAALAERAVARRDLSVHARPRCSSLGFADRNLPARGGRGFQHLAREPQHGIGMKSGAYCATHRLYLVPITLFVAVCLYDTYARPVGFELVGDDYQPVQCPDPSQAMATMLTVPSSPIATNTGGFRPTRAAHRRRTSADPRHARISASNGEDQPAERRRGALEKLPAAHVGVPTTLGRSGVELSSDVIEEAFMRRLLSPRRYAIAARIRPYDS